MPRVAVLAVSILAFLVLAGPATAATSFTDPTGDSGTAPDIGRVTVSNFADGGVLFEIAVPNRPTWEGSESVLWIVIDADRNPATGEGGAEFLLQLDGASNSISYARWNGSEYEDMPEGTFAAGYENAAASIAVTAASLGGVAAFDFWLLAWDGEYAEDVPQDVAPDGKSIWSYRLTVPAIQSFASAPPRAVAGKRFTLPAAMLTLTTGEKVKPTAVSCTAKIAGKPVKKVGACAFAVPANAKGKTLVVTVTFTYKGLKKTFVRSVKIR